MQDHLSPLPWKWSITKRKYVTYHGLKQLLTTQTSLSVVNIFCPLYGKPLSKYFLLKPDSLVFLQSWQKWGLGVTFHGKYCHYSKNVGKLSTFEITDDKWSISLCERVFFPKIQNITKFSKNTPKNIKNIDSTFMLMKPI